MIGIKPVGHPDVDELYTHANVLSDAELTQVMDWLNTTTDWRPMAGPNSRKVIHYGLRYNYNSGGVGGTTEPLPPACVMLRDKLSACVIEDITHAEYVQCIVNKYESGQGIGAHIDSMDFGPVIGCFVFNVGIGDTSQMTFTLNGSDTRVETPHNSLYIMTGLSRYNYRHALEGRKSYAPRVSVTFRSLAPRTRDTTTHRIIGVRSSDFDPQNKEL